MNKENINTYTITIQDVILVVTDDKSYDDLKYSSVIIENKEVTKLVPVLDLQGYPVYNVSYIEAVDQENNKIQVPNFKKLEKEVKENIKVKLNNINLTLDKKIEIKSDKFIEYFRENPIIRINRLDYKVIQFDGWLPQIANLEVDKKGNQKLTLKIFI